MEKYRYYFTLIKADKNQYKTKATELSIRVAKKANNKAMISLKCGNASISMAFKNKEIKGSKARISNPIKKTSTDVLNQNTVFYKNV